MKVLRYILWFVLLLFCWTSYGWADVETVYIAASGDDGSVWSYGAAFPPIYDWEDICAGTEGTQGQNTTANVVFVGRQLSGLTYYFYETIAYFDVPEIDGQIDFARFCFYVYIKGAQDWGTLNLRAFAGDPRPIVKERYKESCPLVGTKTYASTTAGAYNFISIPADTLAGREGAYIAFQLTTAKIVGCSFPPPTGNEYMLIRTYDYGSNIAYLEITYTPTAERKIFGPIVTHEPTANPMVKVSPTR